MGVSLFNCRGANGLYLTGVVRFGDGRASGVGGVGGGVAKQLAESSHGLQTFSLSTSISVASWLWLDTWTRAREKRSSRDLTGAPKDVLARIYAAYTRVGVSVK